MSVLLITHFWANYIYAKFMQISKEVVGRESYIGIKFDQGLNLKKRSIMITTSLTVVSVDYLICVMKIKGGSENFLGKWKIA